MLYIITAIMAINDEQQAFLEQLALRIPRLFEAIRAGNIKSEYIIGVRRIGHRHVQLKMIAEVVDPGVNPLQTHGMQAPVRVHLQADLLPENPESDVKKHGTRGDDGCHQATHSVESAGRDSKE